MDNDPQTKPRSELWWFEPRWSFVPRVKSESQFLKQPGFWIRVVGVSLLITLLAMAWVRRLAPDLEFNWLSAFIWSAGGMAVALLLVYFLQQWLPPTIAINKHGVRREKQWRRRTEIKRLVVDACDPAYPLLCVESASRKLFTAGLPQTVSAAELATFLKQMFPELLVEEKR